MSDVISLLGSTGSIGRQTLETAAFLGLRVSALSAGRNIELLEEQVRRFRPAIAAVYDEEACRDFRVRVHDTGVRVVSGAGGLIEAACENGTDTVLVATVGMAGLMPTLAAVQLGRRIALANKETLVCAGELVMEQASKYGAEIIPVDSEHSAIFQCIRGEPRESVKRLILTASGGPFRRYTPEELENVTPAMALKHPTWKMGSKITIDSATMMNKGFEVIEAMHLFSVAANDVSVVIHPESIVHSMVEFCDNSIAAQLAAPDMRLPIQYALTFPARLPSPAPALDITRLSGLTFEEPDYGLFPCLGLAYKAAETHGTLCSVLNGANEAAVDLFLREKLSFPGIHEIVHDAMDNIGNISSPSCEDIVMAGETAKRFVFERV